MTPYAKAYARGLAGWRRMGEWVWFCGHGRLKHLAMMRSSAASRRFAHLNLVLLALGLGLLEATRTGWRWVTASPLFEPTGSTRPAGAGWVHVVGATRPLPPDLPPERVVDLWWNWIVAAVVVAVALILGFLVSWLLLTLMRTGVRRAHLPAYRGERRMTAALHYGTAWCWPLFLGALVVGARPIAFMDRIRHWPWCPPESGFILSASVVAGFGVIMWWFWLIRLGATAPAKTRQPVVLFFAIGVPVIVAVAAAGWWFGIGAVYRPLLGLMNVEF